LIIEAEAGPSFCKRRKVDTSYKKLKETKIHEILGTEESDEDYSIDTDYSYECSGSESKNENESDSDTESDCDVEQNDNSDENSCVNRYKKLNISWTTEDFIPTFISSVTQILEFGLIHLTTAPSQLSISCHF
jgi:hypothetical protein